MINTTIISALKEKIMNTINQQDSSAHDRVDSKRQIIRETLNDVAQEVGNRLREACLDVPVFLTIPRSGNAIVTMATPLVRQVVSDRLDGIILQSHEAPCAMASSTMSAADLIEN